MCSMILKTSIHVFLKKNIPKQHENTHELTSAFPPTFNLTLLVSHAWLLSLCYEVKILKGFHRQKTLPAAQVLYSSLMFFCLSYFFFFSTSPQFLSLGFSLSGIYWIVKSNFLVRRQDDTILSWKMLIAIVAFTWIIILPSCKCWDLSLIIDMRVPAQFWKMHLGLESRFCGQWDNGGATWILQPTTCWKRPFIPSIFFRALVVPSDKSLRC